MVIGSHNSWSFLKYKKWWMRLFKFMAKCQDANIYDQYEKYGVRCFDLRIKFDKNGKPIFSHGAFIYKYSLDDILSDLSYINKKGDCYVRVIHEARKKSEYTTKSIKLFVSFARTIELDYPNIKFWCGKNLYTWKTDYEFKYYPSCKELYSSVCSPKLIDDWYPRYYAKHHNSKNIRKGTENDILLIDFVNYGH